MKKSSFYAVAALAFIGCTAMSSCGSDKKGAAQTDTDSMEVVEVEMPQEAKAMPVDSALSFAKAEYAPEASGDFQTTASGLRYLVVKEGAGKSPKATDIVKVHYVGHLTNGEIFDSSVERGEPAEFPLDRVIAGWTEGLQLMKEGGKTLFYIPSNLAYGEAGTPGGPIGPNEPLVFEVELIEVK